MHRFLISAAHKSSGKTTVSIGLCAALQQRGLAVQPFKKGPDYIDPLWLTAAAGRPCYSLDPHLSGANEIGQAFAQRSRGADVCLVEGNKGLHDGLALDGSNSNAALATALDLPVILVIDTRGTIRGVAPLVLGYQAFDPKVRIVGVIFNRVAGKRHEAKLRAVMERYTKVPVIGAIPETPDLAIDERHLGLMPSNEHGDAASEIARLAHAVRENVDLDRLLALTGEARQPDQPAVYRLPPRRQPKPPAKVRIPQGLPVVVGIARDAAFAFYYPEDLEALTAAGAELVPIDTLRDTRLPAIDGLFIGGGFPEVKAAELEANSGLRADLRHRIENGLPVYAECGGLMYLTRSITWQGRTHEMVGALPADTVMNRKPVGKGYVEIEPTADHPWLPADGKKLRAHEFHYSNLENLAPDLRYAWRVSRGHGIDGKRDGIVHHNVLGAYCHLRSVAGIDWPAHFVAHVRACAAERRASPLYACA